MRTDRLQALVLAVGIAAVVVLALANSSAIRERAIAALERGMPPREAALARGFVLGEDDEVDSRTVEDFHRSGLGHLLAVSGQNVALLCLLAMPLLAAFGLPLRVRLVWLLGLIAVYVVLAGAGPSIQRAGTMGALSVLATLSGRRTSAFYGLALAAIVTLAIDPRLGADVGWQLSFAAVLGILLLAAPAREGIVGRDGSGGWQRAVADGMGMTVAATLATAPLIAFHFGAVSTTTLAANLLALPAVAPAMWLGMIAAAGAQVPGFPVEVLNGLAAPLLGYLAQVAAWCGRPESAYVELRLGAGGLVASCLVLALLAALSRLRALRLVLPALAATGAIVGLLVAIAGERGAKTLPPPESGLRVSVIDVGQGDAILLQPAGADAILVDAGPPGAALGAQLRAAGVNRLGAAIVSHDQADHAGGIAELLEEMPVGALLYAVADRGTLALGKAAGASVRRLAAGSALRAGPLRLEALWPPRELLDRPLAGEDPNRLSLVLLLRWRRFSMLLPGDAEAEAVPLDPGPLDVLKVAHHGSEDAGLGRLLARTRPRVAVVSVGAGNPFGHPTAMTMATLAEHGVRRFRTDRNGTVVLDIGVGAFRVTPHG